MPAVEVDLVLAQDAVRRRLAVLVLDRDPSAEEAAAAAGRVGVDDLEHVEPLLDPPRAPVDLAQSLLAVDVLGVLGPIALRRRGRDLVHHPRPLGASQMCELVNQPGVPGARDVPFFHRFLYRRTGAPWLVHREGGSLV